MSNEVSAVGRGLSSHNIKKPAKKPQGEGEQGSIFEEGKKIDYDKIVEQNNKKELDKDFAYFLKLQKEIEAGDKSAAQEAAGIKVGSFDKANSPNAQQYNKNTSLLIKIQDAAKALLGGKDEGKNKKEEGNNPFQG